MIEEGKQRRKGEDEYIVGVKGKCKVGPVLIKAPQHKNVWGH
jgi:hypothetical protein